MEPETKARQVKAFTIFLASGLVVEIEAAKNVCRLLGKEQTIAFLSADESVVGFFRLDEISGMSFTDSLSILNTVTEDQ